MSGKDYKVAALLESVEAGPHDPHFAGYIRCFNEQNFYEDLIAEFFPAKLHW